MKNYKDYTKEDWEKLNGYDWGNLLSDKPQFAKYCNWNLLDGDDWRCLLSWQPQFKDSIYYKGWKLKNM